MGGSERKVGCHRSICRVVACWSKPWCVWGMAGEVIKRQVFMLFPQSFQTILGLYPFYCLLVVGERLNCQSINICTNFYENRLVKLFIVSGYDSNLVLKYIFTTHKLKNYFPQFGLLHI